MTCPDWLLWKTKRVILPGESKWLQCMTRENWMSTTIFCWICALWFTYGCMRKLYWSRFDTREHGHLGINCVSYHVFWRQVPLWSYTKLTLVTLAYHLEICSVNLKLQWSAHLFIVWNLSKCYTNSSPYYFYGPYL